MRKVFLSGGFYIFPSKSGSFKYFRGALNESRFLVRIVAKGALLSTLDYIPSRASLVGIRPSLQNRGFRFAAAYGRLVWGVEAVPVGLSHRFWRFLTILMCDISHIRLLTGRLWHGMLNAGDVVYFAHHTLGHRRVQRENGVYYHDSGLSCDVLHGGALRLRLFAGPGKLAGVDTDFVRYRRHCAGHCDCSKPRGHPPQRG